MDPIKIAANLINVQAKIDRKVCLLRSQNSKWVQPLPMSEKIHDIYLKNTLPSFRESNPWDGNQLHLMPNKKLKTRKTQQFASKREETDSFDL